MITFTTIPAIGTPITWQVQDERVTHYPHRRYAAKVINDDERIGRAEADRLRYGLASEET